jgi:hypothetical protein
LVKNRCRFTAGDLKAFFYCFALISFTFTLATIFVSASFLPIGGNQCCGAENISSGSTEPQIRIAARGSG